MKDKHLTKGKREAMRRSVRNNGGLQWLSNCYGPPQKGLLLAGRVRPSQQRESMRALMAVCRMLQRSLRGL